METIKIENKHIVLKKSDLADLNLLTKANNIRDLIARLRKREGRQAYPEYVVVNKDEPYYPDVMQIVIEGEVEKLNVKKAAEMFAEPLGESKEKIIWDLEQPDESEGQARAEFNIKVAQETAAMVDEYILKNLGIKFDEIHVQIDGIDFLRCPDCGNYRMVQYPESFMFSVARLCCGCGFKFEIPSENKTIALGKLKNFIKHKSNGRFGVDSLT